MYKNSIPHLQFLLPPSPPCAALITTRQHELGGAVRVFPLDVMNESQSLELLREAHGLGEAIDKEPDAAKKLCELCGYLPLALDLAGSRLRSQLHFSSIPIAVINIALADRLKELRRTTDTDAHLQSITANIDLSYADLDESGRAHFRALAVFAPSGFAPLAAAALWHENETDACTAIERLQSASLVMDVEKTLGRFRLHDLVRDYAAQKLNECGEADAENRAHAEFLIALFGEQNTVKSRESLPASEFDNLRVVAKWANEKSQGELLARLATVPRNWLYNVFRAWDDWYGWLTSVLRVASDYDPGLKANVLQAIGDVQQFRDERDAALQSYAQALDLFRSVGARLGEANVLAARGKLFLLSDSKQADVLLNQAIQIYNQIDDRYSVPAQIGNFGWALLRLGKPERARVSLACG